MQERILRTEEHAVSIEKDLSQVLLNNELIKFAQQMEELKKFVEEVKLSELKSNNRSEECYKQFKDLYEQYKLDKIENKSVDQQLKEFSVQLVALRAELQILKSKILKRFL